jgi:hypothetical protein
MISVKTYTLAGFEPGSCVPEVKAKSTVPRRNRDRCYDFKNFQKWHFSLKNRIMTLVFRKHDNRKKWSQIAENRLKSPKIG